MLVLAGHIVRSRLRISGAAFERSGSSLFSFTTGRFFLSFHITPSALLQQQQLVAAVHWPATSTKTQIPVPAVLTASAQVTTLTGSTSPCSYTALPTSTSQAAITTSATVPYPYTFTDLYGVVVACESESFLRIAGYDITECDGSSTTEKEVTITVTEVVTTSALSDLCLGGGYYACVLDTENFGIASCPKLPLAEKKCEDPVFENAQSLCESRCTYTSTTYTTTYATLAP
ncbi:unnamed protein product [Penicillium glandicola]